ncbi:hypothetical protein HpHA184_08560 [Helicobacter pylori]
MNHLLILYNPYYQRDVIQQHLSVLQKKSQVGFGKIRSKINDQEKQDSLEEVYKATNEENFLQLFLTDYANLFAAKVIKVSKDIDEGLIPSYYKGKSLILEDFFTQKPNLGNIKFLLRHEKIQYHLEENLNRFINYPFSKSLTLIQKIRNEAVHEKAPGLHEVKKLRNEILGIEGASLLKGILTHKEVS